MPDKVPFVSIVVPTRDRPQALRRALESIQAQSRGDYEVLVVDDGSDTEHLRAMQALAGELDQRFVFQWRDESQRERGPAATRNRGIALARSCYIGFLDDDDYWCDERHLERAGTCIDAQPGLDVYIANQIAVRDTRTVVDTWLPYLERIRHARSRVPGQEAVLLERRDLLQPEGIGFAHVNMLLVRQEILRSTGGFSGLPPYEEDLDFFLRLVDTANTFAYRPHTVAVNTLRDRNDGSGVSSLGVHAKGLYRMLACQHALLSCRRPEVRGYARLLIAGVLKTWAKREQSAGRHAAAADYAAQAAGYSPSLRWLGIALLLACRARFSGTAVHVEAA